MVNPRVISACRLGVLFGQSITWNCVRKEIVGRVSIEEGADDLKRNS
jgi:hypothetical protein